jgi:thioredoxin-related protein
MFRIFTLLLMLYASPVFALELIMVEQAGCAWCARWNSEMAPIYPKTEIGQKAPLKRMDLHRDDFSKLTLKSKVFYTPTFLLIDDNKEIGRLEGFISQDFFWAQLERLAK